MRGQSLRRAGLTVAAPVLAVVFAMIVTSLVLAVAGDPVGGVWDVIFSKPKARNVVNIVNGAGTLYLSALAAAIGFKMNLFNIGVDGQYRVAAFCAAWFGGYGLLPGWLNILAAVLVAMVTGALWAGIAAALRVTRGVSEVIATIMLNAIAGSLVAYLLRQFGEVDGNNLATTTLPKSSWLEGLQLVSGAPNKVYTLTILAVVAGLVYWVLLNRTVFGFSLRATGMSETAAAASGISSKRMILAAMLLSGAVAGLIGMPLIFSSSHSYGLTFQTGLGFAGIAVALLGRNHPVGIGFAAVLFAFLNEQANGLQIQAGVSSDIVSIMQGVIVLSVVIAYAVVQQVNKTAEQRAVAAQLAAAAKTPEGVTA
ncbi:ABC transporter permease [Nocardioides sp.]|uniref:ABC transporter permease n=1 Tax=Nocardioides sp. TaxID=35761 RepID=UPI0039E54154